METKSESFNTWAILELMGHRRLAGRVSEEEIAGHKFVRIDSPDGTGKVVTQFYGAASIYCITPTTEEVVNGFAHLNNPAPVQRYEIEFRAPDPEPEDEPRDDPNQLF